MTTALCLNSSPNVAGATFANTAPMVSSAIPPAPPSTVLVVDDDRDYADSIRDLIEMHTSWSVEVAYRATDAITKVQESRPAVVLLDLELPPLSGFVVAAALVETVDPAYQPVLWAISGNKDLVEAAARDERFRRALLKPVDFAAFMGELKDLQLLPDPVPGSDRKTSH